MVSDIISIDNSGGGLEAALRETEAVARYRGLDKKQTTRLLILTEELMGMARSIAGDMEGSFHIESTGSEYVLHLTARTDMDAEKRYQLIEASSSRTNEAAKGFIGFLRDKFESALMADKDCVMYDSDGAPLNEIPEEEAEWDRYERSILRTLADDIKIGVRGGTVDMVVYKTF